MGHLSNSTSFRLNISATWKQRSYAIPKRYFESYRLSYVLIEQLICYFKSFFKDISIIISHGSAMDSADRYKSTLHVYHGLFEEEILDLRYKSVKAALEDSDNAMYKEFIMSCRSGGIPMDNLRTNGVLLESELEDDSFDDFNNDFNDAIYDDDKYDENSIYNDIYDYDILTISESIDDDVSSNNISNINNYSRNQNDIDTIDDVDDSSSTYYTDEQAELVDIVANTSSYKIDTNKVRFKFYKQPNRLRRLKKRMLLFPYIPDYFRMVYECQYFFYFESLHNEYRALFEHLGRDLEYKIGKPVEINLNFISSWNINSSIINKYVKVRLEQFDTFNEIIFPMAHFMNKITRYTGFLVRVAGRINRQQRASFNEFKDGATPFNTFAYPLDLSYDIAILKYGVASIRIWLSRGFERQDSRVFKNYFKFTTIL